MWIYYGSAGLLIVLIFFGLIISTLNLFKKMLIKIDESESSIDVALTNRFDVLTEMFSAAKGYMKHEQETLLKVIEMRQPEHKASIQEKQDFANEVTKGLQALNVVVEQYPDLKASANFLSLQDELATTENKVAFSRQFYNDNVRSLNTAVKTVPTNFFAGFAKVTEREFYEVEDPQDRNAPKVTF